MNHQVHNGIVHVIGKVITESKDFLLDVLEQDTSFGLFSEAFEKTHLDDSIHQICDSKYSQSLYNENAPKTRKYGYTLFAETDKVFRDAGINDLSDLVSYAEFYYGTNDREDYTSRENALNKFISYHILDRAMTTNTLLYYGVTTAPDYEDQKYEYYETFLKYRLIEVKSGNKINYRKEGSYVAIDDSRSNQQGINGYAHGLKNILVYDEDVMQNDVLNKRIRFDITALSAELTNNNIRWQVPANFWLPNGYCESVKVHKGFFGFASNTNWMDFQSSEFFVYDNYDVTMRLLPIPPGTYEIRLGYQAYDGRGIVQMFFDNRAIGIPIDMSLFGSEDVGWVLDSSTDDNGVSADKVLRNSGCMKGPCSMLNPAGGTFRDQPNAIRNILGTYIFQDYGYHTFRVKNVDGTDDKIFSGDYFEYVPKSYLLKEGRD